MKKQATKSDLKVGVILIDKEGNEFKLENQCSWNKGIWETNKCSVIFANEVKHYTVAK